MRSFPAATFKLAVVSILYVHAPCWTESFTAVPNHKHAVHSFKAPLFSSDGVSFGSIVDTIEDPLIKRADDLVVGPLLRAANHLPAFLSLAYFGLVSMASMMMAAPATPDMLAEGTTLTAALARVVGTTTNAEFSRLFPTLVTPAAPVFLIWPVIVATQAATLGASALRAAAGRRRAPPLFDQDDLTALSLANLAATAWLVISSNAAAGRLPLGSLLVLPIVPALSGYPLRQRGDADTARPSRRAAALVFQLFSSFTSVASLLALAVELQHGGRLPLLANRPELSALVFLLGYFGIVSRGQRNGLVKRGVNALAIGGILAKRILDAAGPTGLAGLLGSVSFWITGAIAAMATKQLFSGD